jgi:hypothetical protein
VSDFLFSPGMSLLLAGPRAIQLMTKLRITRARTARAARGNFRDPDCAPPLASHVHWACPSSWRDPPS